MLRRIKKALNKMASTQSSTQPLTDDPSPKEYARLFKEAYNHHMPPYDFRVWDRYLFSRCTSQNQVLGLLSLYEWLLGKEIDIEKESDIQEIGKWCMMGKFTSQIKKIILKAKRSPR